MQRQNNHTLVLLQGLRGVLTHLHGILEGTQVVSVGELYHRQLVVLFKVLNPLSSSSNVFAQAASRRKGERPPSEALLLTACPAFSLEKRSMTCLRVQYLLTNNERVDDWTTPTRPYLVSLPLGVDHERPPSCIEDNDAIIDAKPIRGQPVNIPLPYQDRIAEGAWSQSIP